MKIVNRQYIQKNLTLNPCEMTKLEIIRTAATRINQSESQFWFEAAYKKALEIVDTRKAA